LTRLRLLVLIGVIVVVAAGALVVLVPATRARLAADPAHAGGSSSRPAMAKVAMQAAPPPPTLRAGPVSAPTTPKLYLFGWAFLDRRTNKLVGSANMDTVTNTTESMIKVWLAADYFRHLQGRQPTQQVLSDITLMIEDSNDVKATELYKLDGGLPAIKELITTCKLTETTAVKSWSYTRITPADAARYGKCIADGAAGPTWTPWLLNLMKNVRGGVADNNPAVVTKQGGHWGIIDALPQSLAQDTSIKNGWTYIYADARWHINCMAIHPDWVLTVEMQFAGSQTPKGLQQGADACASVTRQLLYTPDI
jgi:hypothetical protein